MHTQGWELWQVGEDPRAVERELGPLAADEVLVRVAGCGVCHTDLGFAYEGVPTRHPLPLILGHEIAGWVEDAGAEYRSMVGSAVVVPAVIPCGRCAACRSARPMICQRQVMPGNDRDGGFASHVVVPGLGLCPVPGVVDADTPIAAGTTLRHLAVVADAVSTPYQAVARSELREGQVAIVVGLGGVGGYCAQIAKARGAWVVGLDVDPAKLAHPVGVDLALDPREPDLRRRLKAAAREAGVDPSWWAIYECSGSEAGQVTAWSLLQHGATLMVVGFTLAKPSVRLSNLMAFDARAMGNWGCAPELYPEIVDLVLSGRIDVVSGTAIRPLGAIRQVLDDVRSHRVHQRQVLAPDLEAL